MSVSHYSTMWCAPASMINIISAVASGCYLLNNIEIWKKIKLCVCVGGGSQNVEKHFYQWLTDMPRFYYGDFITVTESSESFVGLHDWLLRGVSLSSFNWCCKLSHSYIQKEAVSMFTFRDKVLNEWHQNCLGIYNFFFPIRSKQMLLPYIGIQIIFKLGWGERTSSS